MGHIYEAYKATKKKPKKSPLRCTYKATVMEAQWAIFVRPLKPHKEKPKSTSNSHISEAVKAILTVAD